MRLAVLTGLGLEHRYVTGRLLATFGSEVAAVIVAREAPRTLRARWRSYRRRYTWRQIASRVAAKLYRRLARLDERRTRALERILFPAGDWARVPPAELLHTVTAHNAPDALALLDTLQPDVIAVYGTAVIREPVMARARRAVLNMHTGLSPQYRGADTVFWPLYYGEPEWIGTTIHQLDRGIDSGPVLATVRPPIDPGDDEDTLFAKCVVAGTAAYVRVLADVRAGTATPQPQDLARGREFRFVDRTVAAERRVARLLRRGLLADFVSRHGARP